MGLAFYQVAELKYTIPCRRTVMNAMDRKYSKLKCLVYRLINGQHCVTLTTDMQTLRAGEGYFS